MTTSLLEKVVELTPIEEAQRLWAEADGAFAAGSERVMALCEAVDLGIRAVEVLGIAHLRAIQEDYPATIGLLLEAPPTEVDPERDTLQVPRALGFLELLDMLSADELPCLAPGLHHGWEDRVASCRRSRQTTRARLGVTLDETDRRPLQLLAAYRIRVFRVPPPVTVDPAEIREAFPTLRDLYGKLLAATS